MVKKLSCVSHGSLKRFPHTFTIVSHKHRVLTSMPTHFFIFSLPYLVSIVPFLNPWAPTVTHLLYPMHNRS